MAAETDYTGGFGRVSRTAGAVFRYALLAATLFGIVVLFVLLVYVANDAVRPLTADPGWHLTFFLALVLPATAVGGYLYSRADGSFGLGITTLGLGVVALLFGAGASMVFVDIVPPLAWFTYTLALGLVFAVVVALQRYSHQLSFLVRFAATVVALAVSLLSVPVAVDAAPVVPTDGIIVALAVGAPAAAAVGRYVARRAEDRRAGRIVGGLSFVAALAAPLLGPALGIGPVPAATLAAVALVPTAGYVIATALVHPGQRIGFLFPAVVVVGSLAGAAAVEVAGFAGPEAWVDWQFLTSPHSGIPEEAGFYPAIGGSIILMVIVAVLSFPIGVGAAIYLEEYAPDNRFTRIIDVNISNLAGVPSVVYGLLGLGLFVTYLGQPPGTAFVGGATLALLILPIVIISAREAIRSVPDSMREASYGMGATRWQTIRNVVLPEAFPGILTGTILALGRAIGETAPLIMIGAPNVFFSLPQDLTSRVGAMPLQIYAWASLFASEPFYTRVVPAGVVVLLVVMLLMNSVAITLRNKYQTRR